MPILPREPDIHPDDLLAEGGVADDPAAAWWVLYTLPRREKDLMRRLRAVGHAFYAPIIRRRSRTPRGRSIESFVPLFAGYVFLCGDETAREAALRTNCVSRCLPVADREQLVHDLRQIQRLVDCDAPLSPEARIAPGTRVRIKSGSLAGLEGTVVTRRGKEWLMVSVEFLQQGASVQLEDFQLEAI